MARLYSLQEAAEALGLSSEELLQWIADGRARATRRGGGYVLRAHEVEKLLGRPLPDLDTEEEPEAEAPAERRRTPGRRKSDQVSLDHVATQLEQTLEKRLAPISRVQVRLLERLEDLQAPSLDRVEELLARLAEGSPQRVRELEAEVEALRSRLAAGGASAAEELEALKRSSEEALRSLRSELAQVRRTLEEERAKPAPAPVPVDTSAFEREVAEARAALQQAEKEKQEALEAKSAVLEEAGTATQRFTAELDRLARDLDSVRAERDRLAEGRKALEARGSQMVNLYHRLDGFRRLLDAPTLEPPELAERAVRALEEARGQQKHLESRLRVVEKERLDLQARVDELQRAENRTGEVEAMEGLVQSLRSELAGARLKLDETQVELAQARELAEVGLAEVNKAKADREKLMAAFEEERKRVAGGQEGREGQYRELEKTLLKLEGERTRLLQKVGTLEEELGSLRAELKSGSSVKEKFDEERVRLQEAQTKLQGQINTVQRELEAAQRQIAEGKEAHDRLLAERDAAAEKARELSEQLKSLSYKVSVGGEKGGSVEDSRAMIATIARLEADTEEKDRLIQAGHQERADLRAELEKSQRALYELQQRFDREKREWSEILAREIKQREAMREQPAAPPAEDDPSRSKGWRLFKPRGGLS